MSSDNDTIDKMAERFKDVDSLKAYCNAQFKTILKLTKRLEQLEKENSDLKTRTVESGPSYNIECPNGITDEEAICIMELNRLRNLSLQTSLSLEECRKVESYVKTLSLIRNQPKKLNLGTENMSAEQLLEEFDKMMKKQDMKIK